MSEETGPAHGMWNISQRVVGDICEHCSIVKKRAAVYVAAVKTDTLVHVLLFRSTHHHLPVPK